MKYHQIKRYDPAVIYTLLKKNTLVSEKETFSSSPGRTQKMAIRGILIQ